MSMSKMTDYVQSVAMRRFRGWVDGLNGTPVSDDYLNLKWEVRRCLNLAPFLDKACDRTFLGRRVWNRFYTNSGRARNFQTQVNDAYFKRKIKKRMTEVWLRYVGEEGWLVVHD